MDDQTSNTQDDSGESGFLDHYPTSRQELPRLERDWLAGRSQEELVELIMLLVERLPKTTAPLNPDVALDAIDDVIARSLPGAVGVEAYDRLPRYSARRAENASETTWRIKLIGHNPNFKPLALEIYDDVFVGRVAGGITPDLDMTPYGGEDFGVSRQHALIRPSQTAIYLIDLGSTNGTFHNRRRLAAGSAQQLYDGDVLSFGRLHFTLKIVSQPGYGV